MRSLFAIGPDDEGYLPRHREVSPFDQNRISCDYRDCRSGGGLVGGLRL